MAKEFVVAVEPGGRVVLPEEMCTRHRLTQPDIRLRVVERDDGVIELHPFEIDPDQAWFWTPEWQAGEREVDEQIARGAVETFDSAEAMFDALEKRRHKRKAIPPA